MAEKKVTKAELRKLETQKRREFIHFLYAQVMETAVKVTQNERGRIQLQVSGVNYNRYIRFSSYGKSCVILIYKNGNVSVKLDELSHGLFETTIFEYTSEQDAQDTFKAKFTEMLEWLIPTFYGKMDYDYHTFMDWIGWKNDLYEAHEMVEKEFQYYKENNRE